MEGMQIFVQVEGKRDIRLLSIPKGATVRQLVEIVEASGLTASLDGSGKSRRDSVAVFVEDKDDPLPTDITLEAAGLQGDSSVHIGRCTRLVVTVHYNGKDRVDTFGPGVPMHRVKEWAVGKKGFDLNPTDAAEHVLQLTGTTDRPDDDVHIGSLIANGCKVEFDLVAKVRVEG